MIKKLFTLIFLIFRGAKRFLVWLIHRDPKKIAAFLLLVAVIVAAARYFIKTVPDYSRPGGYAYVSRSDYAKYQKGYCLKEDRILSDEELFRRAILQYMRKRYELQMKKYWFYENMDWSSSVVKLKYFVLKDKTFDDLKKIVLKDSTREINNLLQREEISKEQIEQLLKIDMKNRTAGFSHSVLLRSPKGPIYFGEIYFTSYLNQSFLLSLDNHYHERSFEVNTIAINYGDNNYEIKRYQKKIKKHKSGTMRYTRKIDNCGNVDYDVEKIYQEIEPRLGKSPL